MPDTRYPKPEPETRYPKPETRNPKPETRYPKPETRRRGAAGWHGHGRARGRPASQKAFPALTGPVRALQGPLKVLSLSLPPSLVVPPSLPLTPLPLSISRLRVLSLVKSSRPGFWGDGLWVVVYRGTSFIRNSAPPGPCSRNMPRALWWS